MKERKFPAEPSLPEEILGNRIPCEWLNTEQAALYLSLSANALRICVHRGQIPTYKWGRRLRFRLEELRQVLSKKGN